jgi:hypothetical protein
VGSRDPSRAAVSIAGWASTGRNITSNDYGSAIAESDVVVLAVPFEAIDALLAEHGPRFRPGALAVDVMVPLSFADGKVALVNLPEGSATEHVKARLPQTVRLAAAFKTVPAHLLNDIERPLDCDEFVCGESPEARAEATALVDAMAGLRAVDVGPLTRARAIEHLTLLAIGINRRHKISDARFKIVGL